MNFIQIFCAHNYEKFNEFVIPSEYDMVLQSGKTPNSFNSLTRKYVTDFKCVICGKIKRKVEKT